MGRVDRRAVGVALLAVGLAVIGNGCSRDSDDAAAGAAPQGKAFRSPEAANPAGDMPRPAEPGSAGPPSADRQSDATAAMPAAGSTAGPASTPPASTSNQPPTAPTAGSNHPPAAPAGGSTGSPLAPAAASANSPNIPAGAAQPKPAAKPQTVPEMIQANPDVGKTQGDLPVTDIDSRDGQYKPISFGKLGGYLYDNYAVEASLGKDGKGKPIDEIPAEVRALDKQKVALRGFMVPIDIKKNEARSFLLVRNRMACCFGMQVGLNEWVFVRMAGDKTARWMNDVPTTVYGTLSVGEDIRDGMIMSIYRMEGDDVAYSGGY